MSHLTLKLLFFFFIWRLAQNQHHIESVNLARLARGECGQMVPRSAQPEPPQGSLIVRTSATRTRSPSAMVARMKSMHSALCEGQLLVSIDSVGRWLAFTLPERALIKRARNLLNTLDYLMPLPRFDARCSLRVPSNPSSKFSSDSATHKIKALGFP